MSEFKLWMKSINFKPVAFYPYTSLVSNRILEQNHNYQVKDHDFIQKFGDECLELAVKAGAKMDNKVVVELKYINENRHFTKVSNLFVGKYDGIICIGLGVWQPDEYVKQYNQSLNS